MASTSQGGNNNDDIETSSSGRYERYNEIIGTGKTKTVYKGYDKEAGKEIAWSKTHITKDLEKNEDFLKLLLVEGDLMKSLDHENIVKCYESWVDVDDNEERTIHMITEYFPSGNLEQYLKKHKSEDNIAEIKNWCRQILNAIAYLHSQSPPIVHRDIKPENIFIDEETGSVKLADFGFALSLEQGTCNRKYGTPRYVATEIHKGKDYNQLVDIYSFGMCVLEMVTGEQPYSECSSKADFFFMAEAGIKPPELGKVKDDDVWGFIYNCLAPASERPSANALLNDRFLASSFSSILSARFLSLMQRICSCTF